MKLWAHSTPAQYTALLSGSWSPHKVSNSDGTFSTSERVQVRPTWLTVNAQGISLGRLKRSCNPRLSAIARLPVRSTKKSTEHRNGHLTPRTYSPFLTHRGIVGFRLGPNRPAFAQKLKGKSFEGRWTKRWHSRGLDPPCPQWESCVHSAAVPRATRIVIVSISCTLPRRC